MPKRLLLIGSRGFIGGGLVTHFGSCKEYEFEQCDVIGDESIPKMHIVDRMAPDFRSVFRAGAFDVCINCSGSASVSKSFSDPDQDFRLNVDNTQLILEAARREAPRCRIVNISSAAVYGQPVKAKPLREYDETKPISPYGFHKLVAEKLCEEYSTIFSIPTSTVRVFSAFGPGLRKQIFWDLYQRFRDNPEIVTLFGTGEEKRDFIYISDVAAAIEAVIENANSRHEVFNVASGQSVSIRVVAETFAHVRGFRGQIRFSGEVREGDPTSWYADVSRLHSLGFKVKNTLWEGLSRYSAWADGMEEDGSSRVRL